jgi:NhaA family Na+:H+ antiporter
MEDATIGVRAPLERLLHKWETPVAILIMPLFSLANAGIALDIDSVRIALQCPVAHGVLLGLLIGKPLGISSCAWLSVQLGICRLPAGIAFQHIIGVSLLAGIGFTMSLFIGELAFVEQPLASAAAKLAVLIASVIAGSAGLLWLYHTASPRKQVRSSPSLKPKERPKYRPKSPRRWNRRFRLKPKSRPQNDAKKTCKRPSMR